LDTGTVRCSFKIESIITVLGKVHNTEPVVFYELGGVSTGMLEWNKNQIKSVEKKIEIHFTKFYQTTFYRQFLV
jgi:hypothetical protein